MENINQDVTLVDSSEQKQQQPDQHEQQQPQQEDTHLSTDQVLASMSPEKESTVTTTSTKPEIKDKKPKVMFYVFGPSLKKNKSAIGISTRMKGYSYANKKSPDMNMTTGIYTTPRAGKYKFAVLFGRHGKGAKYEMYLCGDGEGRRELLGKTDGMQDECRGSVCWECSEGVKVWIEVARVWDEVWGMVAYCHFNGHLME